MAQITGATKLLGVMGYPIEHSLSPVMHNAALEVLAAQNKEDYREYVYVPWPVRPDALSRVVSSLAEMGCCGFNVTIPHKQAIMPLLAEMTAIAEGVGAVNTVWLTPSGWAGTNTDVQGFLSPLQALQRDWSSLTPCILGSGGAARAVLAGCAQLGCPHVHVIGRQPQKLQLLQEAAALAWRLEVQTHPWEDIPVLLPHTDLLINTTPVGMSPHTQASPLSVAEIDQLPATAIVYDLIYTPNPTVLLTDTQSSGRVGINGLEMLVQQGAAALSLWLGQPAPVATMRQALQACFGH